MLSTRRLLLTSVASAAVVSIRAFVPRSATSLLIAPTSVLVQTTSTRSIHVPAKKQLQASVTSMGASLSNGGLFLFDFDGVVCDSCDECTVSALKTCRKLGVLPREAPEYPPPWLFAKMREIRPAIEVGWQIPVLLSVFLEQDQKPGGGAVVKDILSNYERLVHEWLDHWKLTDKIMIDTFGGVRDAWIKDDLESWLDINAFYPGVPEALSACKGESVLVTTKQQRFAVALCRHAGVDEKALPNDDIYGLGMYKSKGDVIAERMAKGGFSPDETRFFEDRWPTLAKCLKDERLDGVHFYLCAWGYVTPGEVELAKAEPRVEVLELADFCKLVAS